MTAAAVEWVGIGWRCWRVTRDGRLLNPWQNSGHQFTWARPGNVEVADCFWRLNGVQGRPGLRCQGLVSARCSCGIRSIGTLPLLGDWMARDRTLDRDPAKATVAGRIEVGGKVQRAIPGGRTAPGYQRSEFARIAGPLYVSPRGAVHTERLRRNYGSSLVRAPSVEGSSGLSQQEWLRSLVDQVREDLP